MSNNKPKIITKKQGENDDYVLNRMQAQKMNFDKLVELLQRNVNKKTSSRFTQYTKELLKQYVLSPEANQNTLRDISKFLERNSMLYRKLITYYASSPLFRYNITQFNSMTERIDSSSAMSGYEKVLKRMDKLNLKNEGYNAIYQAIRDGMYVAYFFDNGDDGILSMPLDPKYLRVYGSTPDGNWIVYMDAAFFDVDNNIDFVTKENVGNWGDPFVSGYDAYKDNPNGNKWFRLPPENTLCVLACSKDQFTYPLPWFLPIFKSLLDLLDLEDILQDKNELENYKLIVNKIPLMSNSENVDDFAISLEMAENFDDLMASIVPELVGVVRTPMEVETVDFNSNSSEDTDALNTAIENLFSNVGASRLVIASGSSTNATGLKYSVLNDMSNTWIFVNQIENWINLFMKKKVANGYKLEIHKLTWYNEEDYISQLRELATLGCATPMDLLSATNVSPYVAYNKLRFANASGIYDLLRPIESSYNSSNTTTTPTSSVGTSDTGRPTVSDDDISEEGQATRDKRGQAN